MKRRGVFLGCMALVGTAGACATQSPKLTKTAPAHPAVVAPAKPLGFTRVHPARYVLLDSVGVSYDEAGEASPIRSRDQGIVSGKRLVLDGGVIVESAPFPDVLVGFRSLPAHLGGGFIFWSDDNSYHAPTFLGKLTPFATVGARGGVRPWFDSFVLRSDIGPLEVNPSSFTVRRTELARFSEMASYDGKIGLRIEPMGRMEVSIDSGKTFRPLTFDEGKKYVGPSRGPGNTLLFHRDPSSDWAGMRGDRRPPEVRMLGPLGTLIPFDPKPNEPMVLEPPNWSMPPEEPALTRRFAPSELGLAAAAGAFVPGNQVVFLKESTLRVLSATTGDFIQDLPLSLGSQEFGHCQPVTLGEDVFLACSHAAGSHLHALRGTPTTVQLEATFPEAGTFVAGLGQRFLFLGRCGSTPPTVRDFPGYGLSEEAPDGGEPDPNAPTIPPPEPPPPPEETPEKPATEATVCVRVADGTWVERRIEGIKDRKKIRILPGDRGEVTVVTFDKPDPDKPIAKPAEGVRFVHVDVKAAKFSSATFFASYEPSEPTLRTVARDVWLDEKDGSVHGWALAPPEDEEGSDADEPSEEEPSPIGNQMRGRIVGVQIKSDGSVTRHPLPEGVENVVVGGPYAMAQAKTDAGPTYFESTDGGRSFASVPGPIPGDLIEYAGGDIEGCSIVGCSLGGGLVRLGWGSDAKDVPKVDTPSDASAELESLISKVFDPHTLVPAKQHKELHCRLNGKNDGAAGVKDAPFAITTQTNDDANIGAAVDRKWTALVTTPFELKPMHRVLFEDVNADSLRGDALTVLHSTSTNPAGIFWRTKEFGFDLSPGAKRKPAAFSTPLRGNIAAEVDKDSFVLLDPRGGDVLLVRGAIARPLLAVTQLPDVNTSTLTLARRVGTGNDVLGMTLVQSGSGDILLGDLDVGRGNLGPLRVAGNIRKLDMGGSCKRGPRDYRTVVDEPLNVEIEPSGEGRSGHSGSSLLTIGSGTACLEASEIRLSNGATLVVVYAGSGSAGHPAMLHEHGKSLPATCTYE